MSSARTASLTALFCLLIAQQAAASVLTPPIVMPDEKGITASPRPGQAPVFRGYQGGGLVDWSLTEGDLRQRPSEVQPLEAPAAPKPVQSKPAAPPKPAAFQPPAPPKPPKPPGPAFPIAPVLAPPQLAPSQF